MADFCGFSPLRMSRSRTFLIDNGTRKRYALAAFRLHAERAIGLAGAYRTTTRGLAHVPFPDGIAHAHDHEP
jgi:hypothetical protein